MVETWRGHPVISQKAAMRKVLIASDNSCSTAIWGVDQDGVVDCARMERHRSGRRLVPTKGSTWSSFQPVYVHRGGVTYIVREATEEQRATVYRFT